MKQRYLSLQAFFFLLLFNLFSLLVFAQDNTGSGGESTTTSKTATTKTDINISTDGTSEWYAQPWVWIVGAAVFILLLIALLRGGGRDTVTSDRVTVKKTVERDINTDV
jgi:hypothetical protein